MSAKRKTAPPQAPKTADEIRQAELDKCKRLQTDLRRHLEHQLELATRAMDGNAAGLYASMAAGDWMQAEVWALAALYDLLRRAEANR